MRSLAALIFQESWMSSHICWAVAFALLFFTLQSNAYQTISTGFRSGDCGGHVNVMWRLQQLNSTNWTFNFLFFFFFCSNIWSTQSPLNSWRWDVFYFNLCNAFMWAEIRFFNLGWMVLVVIWISIRAVYCMLTQPRSSRTDGHKRFNKGRIFWRCFSHCNFYIKLIVFCENQAV